MSSLLVANGLTLDLCGHRILDSIDLAVDEDELHVLLGANGAGKSSLAYCLMGCTGYQSVSGRVLFDGVDITALPLHERARSGLALAWQEPARFEGLTVRDYLAIGARDATPADCLRQVGLAPDDYLARPLDKTLSGGERKRIELAGVLALGPRLAILDEPTAGIDFLSQDEITRVIQALKRRGGGAADHPPGAVGRRGGPGLAAVRRAHRLPWRASGGDRELQGAALPALRRENLPWLISNPSTRPFTRSARTPASSSRRTPPTWWRTAMN